MFKNHLIHYVSILTFIWCSLVIAKETKADTTASSGGNQIVVSPINILLDMGGSGYVDALILDNDGNPIEGRKIQVILQDRTKVVIESDSFVTNRSGYINFSILGRQQGDTVVTLTDGVTSTEINVAIRNLIQNVLPYFYGDMQLSLINPTQDINYVQIQFHEHGDRNIPPVTIRMEAKEMRSLKLSEEIDATLKDGWVEIASTEIILGGTWTNKGYLSVCPVRENPWQSHNG